MSPNSQSPYFSKPKKLIQNQHLIQILTVLGIIFPFSIPFFLLLAIQYIQVVIVLYFIMFIGYVSVWLWEGTKKPSNPPEKDHDWKA